ncbi:TetR/AcrR family transcriptional regulator [Rhizobium sp. YS-1r]|uniref:TetR/AcrR family transcriptional regulator n=1 Tax=Rhizobium sp. YS-1r TaxID=1532558 RepID=UPI000A81E08C|nr:TetR/AcrR family transcriptional regulator [Rhizobium sp. YS-1r]
MRTTANWHDDLARVGVLPAQQLRSRELRDRLIKEGLRIARKTSFDEVGVADICNAVECSTGAFYARFPDKLTLFKAVMVAAAAESGPMLEAVVRETTFNRILAELTRAQVARYIEQKTFFRSAFKVSLESGEAWEPFRRNVHALTDAFLDRVAREPSIDHARVDEARIRFAFQVMYGVLNNTIINQPGPFFLETPEFPEMLEQTMLATMDLPRKPTVS